MSTTDRPSPDDPSAGSRRFVPVPGVPAPEVVEPENGATPVAEEERSGYPDAPGAPPPAEEQELQEEAPPPPEPIRSGYPDEPAAPPPLSAFLPVPVETVEAAREATKTRVRDVGHLLTRYAQQYWPDRTPRPVAPAEEPPRLVGRMGRLIPYMRAIPWVLGALFVLSFVWDFP
ncbi:MAG TPA: hypothetical protein VD838_16745, partial [Anaeromyxobacteraceae bacterium]|nr:hypothetical protein [Anaeromyxobacteraceae bacterium]